MTEVRNNTRPVNQESRSDLYVRTLLRDGETLTLMGQIHYGIYWKAAALGGLSLILLLSVFNLGVFMLIITALAFAYAALTKHYLLLALTNKNVIIRFGIINLDTVQVQMNRIESVQLARTIMGRLLGYASVVVTGTGNRVMMIPFIANADQFRAALEQQLNARDDAQIKNQDA